MTEIPTEPENILDGAKTLSRRCWIWTSDTIPDWTKADEYLSWAQRALAFDDAFGYDAAVCYAKRSVCRLIDSFLVHNHLRHCKCSNYPAKIELLKEVGISIPEVAHDLIIDPRNDIEHSYQGATLRLARSAVQIAELLLKSLEKESEWGSIISLGLNYGPNIGSADNDGESWPWGYLDNPRGSMLMVDVVSDDQKVMIIDHVCGEVRYARLIDFTKEQSIKLSKLLREQISESGYMRIGRPESQFLELKRRLGIRI